MFDGSGHPANIIEVSLSEITSSVMTTSFADKTVSAWPLAQQRVLIGRAMGRVIAHEIGHWLFGPAHTTDGLMQPYLCGRDLIEVRPPALPRAWTLAQTCRQSKVRPS